MTVVRGVVVNSDLGERFPRPRSQQRGSLRPRARRVAVLGVGAGGGHPSRWRDPGCHPWKILFRFFDAISRVWGQFGPENKLIKGHPNQYDVICQNASVLAFHLWPTIFAGAPFRLQNICRNGVPPRSRTTTPLTVVKLAAVMKVLCVVCCDNKSVVLYLQNVGSVFLVRTLLRCSYFFHILLFVCCT